MMNKKDLFNIVETLNPLLQNCASFLWRHPEIGGNEQQSSAYLKTLLEKEGFSIKVNSKLPYAFHAVFGEGKPDIAILGEYDALPGLSQQCSTVKEPIPNQSAGHGCGHNLLGAASVTAAIALKHFLDHEHLSGTIHFYGCPEEELLCGKVKMAYYHMFDGCDFALSWHPMDLTMVYDEGYLANASIRYRFTGKSSHAAFAPELGRSALDAVELMNIGTNYLREHIIDKARVHYTTDSGGFSPNIVPDYASAWYFVRAPHMSDVQSILKRLEKIAHGAALMTETDVSIELDYGCYEMKTNHTFADLTQTNLLEVGPPCFSQEEFTFAKELQKQLDPVSLKKKESISQEDLSLYTVIAPRDLYKSAGLYSSSDSGDISQLMPMNLFSIAAWPLGCSPHTWQATSSVAHSIGQKGALVAAKVISGTAYDLLTKPDISKKIQDEFKSSPSYYKPMFSEL